MSKKAKYEGNKNYKIAAIVIIILIAMSLFLSDYSIFFEECYQILFALLAIVVGFIIGDEKAFKTGKNNSKILAFMQENKKGIIKMLIIAIISGICSLALFAGYIKFKGVLSFTFKVLFIIGESIFVILLLAYCELIGQRLGFKMYIEKGEKIKMSKKLNEKSYCHDCGKEIKGEKFYCEDCLNKNGLKQFSIAAFIIALVQPIAGLFIYAFTKNDLHPGINKACKYVFIVYVVVIVVSFFGEFISMIMG